jgi:hypothetical protein
VFHDGVSPEALADVVREARAAELQRLTEDLDQLELFEVPRVVNTTHFHYRTPNPQIAY